MLSAAESAPLLRMADAALNRAAEGLRVLEDYHRFGTDDPFFTRELKTLRHQLAETTAAHTAARLALRDTGRDVGTGITLPSETSRTDLAALLTANWKRLQEALRTLAETAKLLDPSVVATLEQLRYRVYILERAAAVGITARDTLAARRLYVLIDGAHSSAEFVNLVGALCNGGAQVLQLRDKQLADRELIERGRLLRRTLDQFAASDNDTPTKPLFIMNDRPDLALLCDADGVHVGQTELCAADVRRIVGPGKLIGVSTHTITEARQAVLDGADYIGVGPTFASGTKHFSAFTGLELVRAVTGEIRLPAYIIGGVTLDHLPAVQQAGGTHVAVSGAIRNAGDPAAACRDWCAALKQ